MANEPERKFTRTACPLPRTQAELPRIARNEPHEKPGWPSVSVQRVSSQLSDEAKQKESELRAYLLDHRRRMEGGKKDAKPEPAPAPAGDAPPEAPKGEAKEDGKEGKDKGDGFDMFNDDVEEADVAEEERLSAPPS